MNRDVHQNRQPTLATMLVSPAPSHAFAVVQTSTIAAREEIARYIFETDQACHDPIVQLCTRGLEPTLLRKWP